MCLDWAPQIHNNIVTSKEGGLQYLYHLSLKSPEGTVDLLLCKALAFNIHPTTCMKIHLGTSLSDVGTMVL